ncbi:PL29 family lyase N-terminal domain-containing protein [Phocaeicola sartorii]|uniref:PL29 family lyase N-terminal domain-containing protein n=2 Tax=Phocaeicola sartorii TaxID=671267 RepID=UPI002432D115|nr:PL29 family lyase N-terminal domain-containing protein [Phocaeicola sartorii]
MNKKFLSAILFGALMVSSTGTFVSCKDYDDDIDNINKELTDIKATIASLDAAIKAGKSISSYTAVANGYELTFTDGSKITISNGKDGAQGEQGLQGIQGPAGPAGSSIVPKFKVDADSYWMVSVDEGGTYEYVLNEAGEKIKATGANASADDIADAVGNLIFVDEDGYINIGDYKTSFKYNANIPSMIYNEKDQTMKVTVDGKEYTLLMEGSAFNGLQTIVYRKQSVDDIRDIAYAYLLKYKDKDGNADKDVLFASVPAKAEFKVYPETFSLSDAEFYFSDTYKTTRAAVPTLSYVEKSASLENGILSVSMRPQNMVSGTNYKTSLDVKMYNQYVSASDYFNVKVATVYSEDIHAYRIFPGQEIDPRQIESTVESTNFWYFADKFNYAEQFNLNDSVNAAVVINNEVMSLAETNIEYTQSFKLIDQDMEIKFGDQTIKTRQGIFEVKDGILAVKEAYQSSAINEYAGVEVTTTVKSQVEGVDDYVFKNTIFVKAVRPEKEINYGTVDLIPNAGTLALDYNATKTQIISLNVRKFESEVGGRDVVAGDNFSNMNYLLPLYAYNEETKRYERVSVTDGVAAMAPTNSDKVTIAEGDILLYYRNGGINADKDSLFLMVGKKAKLPKTTLYVYPYAQVTGESYRVSPWGGTLGKNGMPYAVWNNYDAKYFALTLTDVSVTRNFSATVKEEYKAQTIIGKWSADKTTYTLESNVFDDMYTVIPTDATLAFNLDAEKQNDYVKGLITAGTLTFEGNTVKFTAPVDAAKVKELKIDLYDGTVAKDNFYRTDTWKVQSPLKAFAGTANLGKFYDATLAKNTVIDFVTYAKTVLGADKKTSVWNSLVLKDYIDQDVVKYNAKTGAFDLLAAEKSLYRTADASTGLTFSTKTEGWTIEDGKLKCTIDPTGTIYEKVVTVTVSYVHDFGTSSFDFTIEVIRNAKP